MTYFNLALPGIGLARFIKSHYNYCCAKAFTDKCLLYKFCSRQGSGRYPQREIQLIAE